MRALESTPGDATHWSTHSMAEASGRCHMTIQRIWKVFGLEPPRNETFKLSTDPQFVEPMRDIVGFYTNPPERALVPCVEKKTQIKALNRNQPLLPMRPGQAEPRSHDYFRHGTTSLLAALDTKTGRVLGGLHHYHRFVEFRRLLDAIDAAVPAGLDVHLILDSYGTHRAALIRRWLARRPRYHVHFARGVRRSMRELKQAIRHYLKT